MCLTGFIGPALARLYRPSIGPIPASFNIVPQDVTGESFHGATHGMQFYRQIERFEFDALAYIFCDISVKDLEVGFVQVSCND